MTTTRVRIAPHGYHVNAIVETPCAGERPTLAETNTAIANCYRLAAEILDVAPLATWCVRADVPNRTFYRSTSDGAIVHMVRVDVVIELTYTDDAPRAVDAIRAGAANLDLPVSL